MSWANLILAFATAFLFTTSDGVKWQFTIPEGWHVIDTPEGLAEGVHVRIASCDAMSSANPGPPPGEASIVVSFPAGADPEVHLYNFGKASAEAARAEVAASLARVSP